jgi:preprotein translocase subunit SecE
MASTEVETVSTSADKIKVAASALVVVAGLVAFYQLSKQGPLIQWAALLGAIVAAAVLFFTSEWGRQLSAFGVDAKNEVRKVVWPTRKETTQMTGYVFAFVVVMALFLWLTDKTLEWAIFDLILGWKK